MIVAGQRVESLNCGWVVALEDSELGRGVRVKAQFEDTGNVKNILTPAFVTGNMRDTAAEIVVGSLLKSTHDGNFEILKIQSSRSVIVKFLNTGNIVGGLQKDAVICGYVKDQVLQDKIQAKLRREQEAVSQAYQDRCDKAEDERIRLAKVARGRRELTAIRKSEREKQLADYYANKAARDVELRENALKALYAIEAALHKGENPNDVNVDFKDRGGNWVLHFGYDNKFYHTRLGRYHNNMTQRIGRGDAYGDVTVCKDFLDAQKFCDWAVQQPGWGCGYSLEKDLLIAGNREYSPEACCFVPHSINSAIIQKQCKTVVTRGHKGWAVKFMKNYMKIFLGVYPTQDEATSAYKKYLKYFANQLAKTYQNSISGRAYEALLSWQPA